MRKTLLLSLFLFATSVQAQFTLDWSYFKSTTYDLDSTGAYVNPVYSEALQEWDDKEIFIVGYIVPLNVQLRTYVISAYPLEQCFFCGNAGPETVIQLYFKDSPPRLLTDQYVILKGKLKLEQQKPGSFFFTLYQTELAG